MKAEKINNIWRFICNEHDFEMRKVFPDVKFVNYSSNDDYLDILDAEGNEYTLYKSDIKHFYEEFLKNEGLTLIKYELEEYLLEKMIENINIKVLTDQDADRQEQILETIKK